MKIIWLILLHFIINVVDIDFRDIWFVCYYYDIELDE